jgi:tetratricopeptide (TPR) repeat protein
LEEAPTTQVPWLRESVDVVLATEVVEHLSATARDRVFALARDHAKFAVFSVPNNRLGPDEEPQHAIKFTALEFKRELERYFQHVRVEVLGPYLLGVCGFDKGYRLSVTLPVRDEARDLEPVLASFRGVADEIVIGVDPRTVDNTREIARAYAEVVFDLESPEGPPDEFLGEGKFHFAHNRNQCIERCTGDWIFMTEGHERLISGQDTLLRLKELAPEAARVGLVLRTGNGQQWGFPWLFRRAPDLRFTRAVHNELDFPNGTFVVKLPEIRTLHDRHHERAAERAIQRKAQNRTRLLDDWLSRQSTHSLFYLAQEWRGYDSRRAFERLEEFLAVSNNGVQRYQARLILAKERMLAGDARAAREILQGATTEDWSRTEHWLWLGDIAFNERKFEQAYRFYRYSATTIGEPPFTAWWIDLSSYQYLPAQRLAMVCGELGRPQEALHWARKATELLPDDSPQEAYAEAQKNIELLEEACDARFG